ncbi:major capsid protein [Ensifer soli]|uniref:major capsid protein n=1 Tax=Ciceribacter sp. sgz301302 TaxID=3342379 RepID=UPI0035B8D71D
MVKDTLESKVPREYARDASAVPGIDLGMRASSKVMNSLTLTLENDQARLATNAANYDAAHKETLSGTDQWKHASSKPTAIISEARQAIRSSCGMYPNVMVLGPVAYAALKDNEYITNRFRNVDIVTADMLAKLFELDQVVEGRAVVADDAGAFSDVWGNYAVLAYAPAKPGGQEEPSYGYTYTMTGHPFVETPYWEPNVKSWIYGVTCERQPV